jgi:hypothetical protein
MPFSQPGCRQSSYRQPECRQQLQPEQRQRGPQGSVTDGTSIWVVNDSSSDKVFKYNAANGALLGSWTISTAGITPVATSPTGITLDPASPSHLWIVDSGTGRVYQYDAAVGRTSGSHVAATSFALAAGNTNPQGIADPPVNISLAAEFVGVHTGMGIHARVCSQLLQVPASALWQ